MTKASELAELDDDELQNRLASGRRELLNLRFQVATGQLDNTERLGEVRRDIARALTILRSRDLSEELVELEPLVLTPARRLPVDETGGVEDISDTEEDEDGAETEEADQDADGLEGADVHDQADGADADDASDLDEGDEEDAE